MRVSFLKVRGASTLPEIKQLGFSPMDLRYLFISINYKTKVMFSTEALEGAKNARLALIRRVKALGSKVGKPVEGYVSKFKRELENNLNISEVLALVNDLLKSSYSKEDILATVYDIDTVLGLNLKDEVNRKESIDEEIQDLLDLRMKARNMKDFKESDRLRDLISKKGYKVLDTADGQSILKNDE